MSDRIERMRDAEAWMCPLWCVQPDDEKEHYTDWTVFTARGGVQFFLRMAAPWERQGVGGPYRVELSTAGGQCTVDEEDLQNLVDEHGRLDGLADHWHVYEYPITDSSQYREAWDGSWDEWREQRDAEDEA